MTGFPASAVVLIFLSEDTTMKKYLQNSNIQDGVVVFVLGLALFCYSMYSHATGIPVEWKMSPYLFPCLLSVFAVLLAVSLLADGYHEIRSGEGSAGKAPVNLLRVAVIVALALAYYFLLPVLTFIPATILFLAVFISYLGERRWWLTALISVAAAGILYFLFGVCLNVMLP